MATRTNSEARGKPIDARQVRSRKALTEALLALVEEKPFDQITIREITGRAGVGYSTFFRHFDSKEELLGAIASEELSRLLELTVPMLTESGSLRSCRAVCAYVADHRALWRALITGGATGLVRENFVQAAAQFRQLDSDESSPVPVDLALRHGTSATLELLSWWLGEAPHHSPDEVGEYLNMLVAEPLTRNMPRGG